MAKKNIYANLIAVGSYSYSYTFIQFLASTVISRLLSPEEYGLVAMITVFSGFVAYFKDAGLSYVVIREDYGRQFYKKIQFLSLIIGLTLMFVIASIAYPISIFYDQPKLLLPTFLVAMVLLVESISIVPAAILKKEMRFKELGKLLFIGYVSGSLVTMLLAFLKFSYWSLIVGQFLAVLIIYLLLASKIRLYVGSISLVSMVAGWRKTKYTLYNISGSRFIQYWSSNADNLIVGKVFGAYSLGIYNRAYQLLTLQMNLISGLFNTVLLPSLKEDKKKSIDQLVKSYYSALNLMALVILPITIILVLFPVEIITFIWGNQWLSVAPIAAFFGVMSIPFVLSRTFGNIYILFNKESLLFKIGILSSILSVVSIIVGSFYGLREIAFAISLIFISIILPVTLYLSFYRNFKWPAHSILRFWLPKIILGVVLLIAIYLKKDLPLIIGIVALSIHIIWEGSNHIHNLYSKLWRWIKT